jgi:hypothetical protein
VNVYTVVSEFSAPQLGIRLHVLDTVGKIGSRVSSLIGAVEYTNQAFYDWLGSVNSLIYLAFVGALPDPSAPGVPNLKSGSQDITSGNDYVTIAGAALGFVPSGVAVVVAKPTATSDNLFATVRVGTITADGFTADLSAPASEAGFKLYYVAME